MEKKRMLLLPQSFIESYLQDLTDLERLEIMSLIFNWYLNEPLPTIKNKLVKVLFDNLLPILEGHKSSYTNGAKGGAPKGNTNAKKTTPLVSENNPTTTPVVLENKPKEKEKEKDKENDKDIEKEQLEIIMKKLNIK